VRVPDQWRNRREIIQHVVLERIESAVQDIRTQETQVNRITIGPRASGAAGTDAPLSSGDVFDDDRLSKRTSYPFGDDSADDINCGAAILKVGIWAGLIRFFGFSAALAGW
jgi:hypothetical protein